MTTASGFELMLHELGVYPDLLSDAEKAAIDADGYLVLAAEIDDAFLDNLADNFDIELQRSSGEAPTIYNREDGALRIADCVNRGPVFTSLIHHPRALAAVARIIGRPFKLDSFNGRDVVKGGGLQNLHADNPDNPDPTSIANTLWLLDDFTPHNGATRLVPGSHRREVPITAELPDRRASHPEEILVTARRGSVLVINGHIWHGGTENTSGARRRALLVSYVARELPQQVDYRSRILPATQARLGWADRYLLDVA